MSLLTQLFDANYDEGFADQKYEPQSDSTIDTSGSESDSSVEATDGGLSRRHYFQLSTEARRRWRMAQIAKRIGQKTVRERGQTEPQPKLVNEDVQIVAQKSSRMPTISIANPEELCRTYHKVADFVKCRLDLIHTLDDLIKSADTEYYARNVSTSLGVGLFLTPVAFLGLPFYALGSWKSKSPGAFDEEMVADFHAGEAAMEAMVKLTGAKNLALMDSTEFDKQEIISSYVKKPDGEMAWDVEEEDQDYDVLGVNVKREVVEVTTAAALGGSLTALILASGPLAPVGMAIWTGWAAWVCKERWEDVENPQQEHLRNLRSELAESLIPLFQLEHYLMKQIGVTVNGCHLCHASPYWEAPCGHYNHCDSCKDVVTLRCPTCADELR